MHRFTTLPSLLWNVIGGLEQAYVRKGAGRVGMPPLDIWANLLRVIDESGMERSELPAALRLSRRAVRTRISAAVRQGWIEARKLARGRGKIRLTARGSVVASRWKEVEKSAEKAWCERVGSDRAECLRSILNTIVAALPLEHPHFPARYGPGDARITGGNGLDWKPVLRNHEETVSELSLLAMTSQALAAFAMAYEERSLIALSASLSVISRIPAEGIPLRTLGHSVDVSALHRHGFLRLRREHGKELAYLTSQGLAVSVELDKRIHAVELEWSHKFGAESVTALRSALEDVVQAFDDSCRAAVASPH